MKLPFHATVSEQRIISELFAIAKRRGKTPPGPDAAPNAAAFIEALEAFLFPETNALIKRRAERLDQLNAPFAHATFDRDLETAEIRLQATIRSSKDYQELIKRLQEFDFDAWVRHCAAERQHAD